MRLGIEDQQRLAVDVELHGHRRREAVAALDVPGQVRLLQALQQRLQLGVQSRIPARQRLDAAAHVRFVAVAEVEPEAAERLDVGLLHLADLAAQLTQRQAPGRRPEAEVGIAQHFKELAPQLLGRVQHFALLLHEPCHVSLPIIFLTTTA